MEQQLFTKHSRAILYDASIEQSKVRGKSLLLLALVLFFSVFSVSSSGQAVNNRYYFPSASVMSGEVAPNEGNGHIFFTTATTSGPTVYLVKTDLTGGILNSIMMPNLSSLHRIMETIDNGVVVFAADPGGYVLIKYDVNLVQLWTVRFPMPPVSTTPSPRLDIEKIYYPQLGEEHYYVVAPATVNAPGYTPGQSVFMVARVKQGGGGMWSKVYYDLNKTTSPYPFTRETINSITSMPNSTGSSLVLGGFREDQVGGGQMRRLFYLMIDENGTVIAPYKAISTVGTGLNSATPFYNDVMWDGANFVGTFADESLINPTGTQASIGLLKLSPALIPIAGKHYTTIAESFGYSISQSSDHNYILNCIIQGIPLQRQMFLKIDQASLVPIWHKIYNNNTDQLAFNSHRTSPSDHNYVMVRRAYSGMFNMNKLLKTDPAGDACGVEEVALAHSDFTPTYVDYSYKGINLNYFNITYPYNQVNITYDSCIISAVFDASNYRTVNQSGAGEEIVQYYEQKVEIYPTLLHSGDEINCVITSPDNKVVEIAVVNVVGQQVYKETRKIIAGYNKFSIPSKQFAAGVNVLKITSNGAVIKTEKLTIGN